MHDRSAVGSAERNPGGTDDATQGPRAPNLGKAARNKAGRRVESHLLACLSHLFRSQLPGRTVPDENPRDLVLRLVRCS